MYYKIVDFVNNFPELYEVTNLTSPPCKLYLVPRVSRVTRHLLIIAAWLCIGSLGAQISNLKP